MLLAVGYNTSIVIQIYFPPPPIIIEKSCDGAPPLNLNLQGFQEPISQRILSVLLVVDLSLLSTEFNINLRFVNKTI